MKLHERAEVVKAMEIITRCINDGNIFKSWLMCGVADGDIDENTTDEDLAYYCEDENFADLMGLFIRLICRARNSGGLYCDKVLDSNETKRIEVRGIN